MGKMGGNVDKVDRSSVALRAMEDRVDADERRGRSQIADISDLKFHRRRRSQGMLIGARFQICLETCFKFLDLPLLCFHEAREPINCGGQSLLLGAGLLNGLP